MKNSDLKPDESILREFDETTNDLLNTLSSFSDQQLNRVPFEGSWSAGQVAEHILKSDSSIVRILNGKTKQTAGRQPDANEAAIRSIFLDFKTKFQSADNVFPSDETKDKEDLSKGLKETRNVIRKILDAEDLTLTCSDFPFPGIGEMTRHEWICFMNCHTIRHTRQMKNIYTRLLQS